MLITGTATLISGCTVTPSQSGLSALPSLNPTSVDTQTPAPTFATLPASASPQSTISADTKNMTTAILKTSKGEIALELFPDKAPETVKNFINKAKSGYYKDLTFHRVEDWVIQGGDPLGNGTGGGKMPSEINDVPFKEGSLGVARGGDIKVNNDSQFFICTTDCSFLTSQYTNFGQVTAGMDVAKKMQIGDKILGIEVK